MSTSEYSGQLIFCF